MNKQAFLQGFIEKCSEYNFTVEQTNKLLKAAVDESSLAGMSVVPSMMLGKSLGGSGDSGASPTSDLALAMIAEKYDKLPPEVRNQIMAPIKERAIKRGISPWQYALYGLGGAALGGGLGGGAGALVGGPAETITGAGIGAVSGAGLGVAIRNLLAEAEAAKEYRQALGQE